jgi:hypothetical protein
LPTFEHHTYSEDDEEDGIKIKQKQNFFLEDGNFWRAEVGKKVKNKKFIFIPNHHFWMSEGS